MPHPVKQILVDVSNIIHFDHKTGVQRVVRNVLNALREIAPDNCHVVPVYSIHWQPGYRYAREFGLNDTYRLEDYQNEPIQPVAGDIFLGLDLHHRIVLHQAAYYAWLRQIGVQVYFVVYDLLPMLMPDRFDAEGVVPDLHRRWIAVLALQDGIICISRTVADEVCTWLDEYGTERKYPLQVGWFHLGRDNLASVQEAKLSRRDSTLLRKLAGKPVFLMVGTLEPRKGYAQTLSAFDLLWQQGNNVCLVMVGKRGWKDDALVENILNHPERNHRLFWLDDANDALRERLYQTATCLIYASEGEGFGLPLIEAANHGLALLVRDLPVFREIANGYAQFFPDTTQAQPLASFILNWLELYGQNRHPQSSKIQSRTWQRSAQQLLETLFGTRWYKQWPHMVQHAGASGDDVSAVRPTYFHGRVFFDHQPKTAGQAINAWLADTLGNGSITDNLIGNHRELLLQFGGKYPIISGHALFAGEGLDPRYQYLTVLREPVDRSLSWLYFLINNHGDEDHPLFRSAAQRMIESDGRYIHPDLLGHISNVYTEHFSRIDQNKTLNTADKLAAALQAIRQYALVGLFEDLAGFTRAASSLLGLPVPEQLSPVNVTVARPKLDRTSPALRKRLVALNQLDIAFYQQVHEWIMAGKLDCGSTSEQRLVHEWSKFQNNTDQQKFKIPPLTHPLYYLADSKDLYTQTGILNEHGHRTAVGQAGFLMHGPYVALPAGKYSVTLYGYIDSGSNVNGAWVDITYQGGCNRLCHMPLMPIRQRGILLYLPFVLMQDCSDVEIRLWVESGNHLRFEGLEIRPD